jgi:hypothetical protein
MHLAGFNIPIQCDARSTEQMIIFVYVTFIIVCRVLVRKPEVKKPLGGPSRRWEDINPLPPNDIHCIYISSHTANLQTLHFKYLFNKYPY